MTTACTRAEEALARVREFVRGEQQRMAPVNPEAVAADERFMELAADAVRTCTRESLAALLGEIRGLSHYFCSYSPRLDDLDPILDDLYRAVRDGMAELET